MKTFALILIGTLINFVPGWGTDFEKARLQAARDHKLVLLNFSGSDWCSPCIRMHDEIFEKSAFKEFAEAQLELVKADFPRLKKNALSKDQQQLNEKLADTYNPKGIFPLTLLLDSEGKILKSWEGFPKLTPEQFVQEIKDAGHVASNN